MVTTVVLEDERIVKNFVTLLLRQHGYHVRQASTPEEADRICNEQDIHLLVADVKLAGGRSGTEFAVQLLQAKPEIRCLFISGLPFEDWSARDGRNVARLPDNSYVILEKPLSPADLLKAIDKLLPKPKPSTAKEVRHFIPVQPDGPWLKTMRDLLSDVQTWLAKRDERGQSWNLYTATVHVCLEEMRAVAGGRAKDELAEFLHHLIPHIEATFSALQHRDRQAAMASLGEAVRALT